MRYPRTLPWMLLPLAACTGEVKETEPVMSEVDGGSPQSISVTSTVGVGTVDVPILMRNEFGAASGGGSVTVAVSGTYTALAASTLSFDDGGYAFASVTSSAPSKFTVSVTGATDDVTTGAEEASYAVYGDLPGLQIDRGTWLPEDARGPDTVVAGTDGVIAATTRTVWWVPGDPGVPAHMVAELPFAIGGMEGADLDGDGLRDVIIWGGSYVVALRGREGGGMSWGGAWSPDSGDVVGAAAADLDGDRLTDIAVGITNDITSNVQILTGDGAWTFEPTAVLELNYAIESIAATDDGRDGRADVIVLSGLTGWLRRYTWSEDGWVGGSPPELDAYTAASGARLLPHMDLDDDGVTDVLLVGAPGSSQDFVYYTMNPDEITLYEIDFPSVNPAVTDITGDGVPEMLVLSSENLSVISYQGEDASSRFRRSKMSIGEREGPIGAVDLNGDGAAEVAVATTHLDWFQGELDEGTWGTTSAPQRSSCCTSCSTAAR